MANASPEWHEVGVFQFFKMSPEVIKEFSIDHNEDFLNFSPSDLAKPDEVDFFLRDPETSIEMLDRYPAIKNLFIKYNTAIPSSAPVERLFSQAALVLTVRRNRLSDILLEMLILLKMSFK